MKIRVLFFGVLKDLAGQPELSVSAPDRATLRDVLDDCEKRIPRLKEFNSSIAISLNQEYAEMSAAVKEGDEIGLLPPVSGGHQTDRQPDHCRVAIVHEVIDTQQAVEKIKHAEDGAVAVFEGIVRNHSRGRRTLFLEYEAYESMALKQMNVLADQAKSKFPVRDVAIIHRLGRLEIGETSVLIIAASAHRAAAFDACRWLIDALKTTVPIWKKEHFEDGVVWADGEPFPAAITQAEGTHSGKRTI
ncbi:MAG: molybdenum cofactor biosynthesis protein MoaE [Acidobacteriales bacterium]|nr:molybdenum cofactor biosynthesis protein MoaE [Terriglobales bacterium]